MKILFCILIFVVALGNAKKQICLKDENDSYECKSDEFCCGNHGEYTCCTVKEQNQENKAIQLTTYQNMEILISFYFLLCLFWRYFDANKLFRNLKFPFFVVTRASKKYIEFSWRHNKPLFPSSHVMWWITKAK